LSPAILCHDNIRFNYKILIKEPWFLKNVLFKQIKEEKMKSVVLAVTTALALTQVASAQTNNAQTNSANTQAAPKSESVRQDIKTSLQQAGFTNITVVPEAFYIHAKDKSGNPVAISVDPNSFEELAILQTGESNAPKQGTTSSVQKEGLFTTVPSNDKLSSKLMGVPVYNNANQNIGTIKDMSVDQNGVEAYILAVGGFLGMGDHYVAVNPAALHIAYNSSDKKWQASLNATADQLKAAPEFKYTGAWSASKL
jgi:hypothetical protein